MSWPACVPLHFLFLLLLFSQNTAGSVALALPEHVMPPPPPLRLRNTPLLQRLLKGVSMNAVFMIRVDKWLVLQHFYGLKPQTGS